jgi:hypothetical protein
MGEKPESEDAERRRPRWKLHVDERGYDVALDHLTRLMDSEVAARIVADLREETTVLVRVAVDLLRAAELPLLPREDARVACDLAAIARGEKLPLVLCLRGTPRRRPLVLDGHHRVCASYWCAPDADVFLKMV